MNVLSYNPKLSYVTSHSIYAANLGKLYIAYGVKYVRRFGECDLPLLLTNWMSSYRHFMHFFEIDGGVWAGGWTLMVLGSIMTDNCSVMDYSV